MPNITTKWKFGEVEAVAMFCPVYPSTLLFLGENHPIVTLLLVSHSVISVKHHKHTTCVLSLYKSWWASVSADIWLVLAYILWVSLLSDYIFFSFCSVLNTCVCKSCLPDYFLDEQGWEQWIIISTFLHTQRLKKGASYQTESFTYFFPSPAVSERKVYLEGETYFSFLTRLVNPSKPDIFNTYVLI